MALWGNKDLVYSDGTVQVNLTTSEITGATGVVSFTANEVASGNVITVGAGATYGYAIITGVTSTTLSIASTAGFVSGLSTVPATTYEISEEPLYTVLDSHYRAPEAKTSGFSTSPVTTSVYGVDHLEVGVAATTDFPVAHSGWVGITTYIDTHGNLRVKSEVLVAGGILTTTDSVDEDLI